MKRIFTVLVVIAICIASVGATRYEPIDFEASGFQVMSTTAYILKGTTANGGTTRPGICASSIDRIGDVAIVYTLEGEYLGLYECTDTGREGGGVRAGTVLDIWKANMTQAESYMRLTGGKVYVKWIEGDG